MYSLCLKIPSRSLFFRAFTHISIVRLHMAQSIVLHTRPVLLNTYAYFCTPAMIYARSEELRLFWGKNFLSRSSIKHAQIDFLWLFLDRKFNHLFDPAPIKKIFVLRSNRSRKHLNSRRLILMAIEFSYTEPVFVTGWCHSYTNDRCHCGRMNNLFW